MKEKTRKYLTPAEAEQLEHFERIAADAKRRLRAARVEVVKYTVRARRRAERDDAQEDKARRDESANRQSEARERREEPF